MPQRLGQHPLYFATTPRIGACRHRKESRIRQHHARRPGQTVQCSAAAPFIWPDAKLPGTGTLILPRVWPLFPSFIRTSHGADSCLKLLSGISTTQSPSLRPITRTRQTAPVPWRGPNSTWRPSLWIGCPVPHPAAPPWIAVSSNAWPNGMHLGHIDVALQPRKPQPP